MQFTSYLFLGFLAATVALYYLLPQKFQNHVLLIASGIFYLYAGLSYFVFLSTTILTVFYAAIQIQNIGDESKLHIKTLTDKDEKKAYKRATKKRQKGWMLAALLFNLGILAVLKYTDFMIGNANSLLSLFGQEAQFALLNLVLPLGISFYTFQTVGYLIDVYWGRQPAQRNLFQFALFASFFPQMIQGPSSRYGEVSKTMFQPHDFDRSNFYLGSVRILYGFFKKLVIADRLLPLIYILTSNPDEYQGIYFLLTMLLYAIALYGDFTGGIDITIGIAKMLGITLAENFNRPYLSRNIAEYWRRWHITMGTWFRDYIFYPLSVSKSMLSLSARSRKLLGNNLGKRVPFYLSTLIVWFATGVWHGATWNFIAWGLTNGIVILISQEFTPLYRAFHKKFPGAETNPGFIAFTVFRTFWLMCFIRAFDCYSSVGETLSMYASVFTNFSLNQFITQGLTGMGYATVNYLSAGYGVAVLLFVGYLTRGERTFQQLSEEATPSARLAVIGFLALSILLFGAYGMGYDSSQFIYNQF